MVKTALLLWPGSRCPANQLVMGWDLGCMVSRSSPISVRLSEESAGPVTPRRVR